MFLIIFLKIVLGHIFQESSSNEEMMDVEETKRLDEMSSLRGELIPQTFLLLHSVLHNTGQFQALYPFYYFL